MTVALAEVSRTLSDRDLSYVESAASAPHDVALTRDPQESNEFLLPFPGGTIIVRRDGEVPAWLEPTLRVLEQLLWLAPNWDSYGALPVDVRHALAALELLAAIMRDDAPIPIIGPTNRGGIQIEWHERGIDLEIETLSVHMLRASFEDSVTGTEWDRELGADLNVLTESIALLSSR